MANVNLPTDWLDSLYEEIKNVNEEPDKPSTYLTDPQKGLANACGISPEVYLAAYADWRDIKDVLDDGVAFKNEFEATHRDKNGKKLSPATGT
jgi:hypothetical protein